MQGLGVVVGRRRRVVVARHRLYDEGDEAGDEAAGDDRSDRPNEDLAADDDASEIHVLLLLLLAWAEQPALLRLVQRPRQSRPVQVLQVPAPVVVGGRVRVYLQGATPRISTVHAHLARDGRLRINAADEVKRKWRWMEKTPLTDFSLFYLTSFSAFCIMWVF